MKKLTLTLATTLLAIACVANAENSTNSTTAKQDAAQTVRPAEKSLTYADFQMIKRQVDFRFQQLKSISLVAMQCHMTVDRANRLFERYAHQDAEKYLASLKRNSSAATLPKNTALAAPQGTNS